MNIVYNCVSAEGGIDIFGVGAHKIIIELRLQVSSFNYTIVFRAYSSISTFKCTFHMKYIMIKDFCYNRVLSIQLSQIRIYNDKSTNRQKLR